MAIRNGWRQGAHCRRSGNRRHGRPGLYVLLDHGARASGYRRGPCRPETAAGQGMRGGCAAHACTLAPSPLCQLGHAARSSGPRAGALLHGPDRADKRQGALAAVLLVAFCIIFWTLPRWLDAAVNDAATDLLKTGSLIGLAKARHDCPGLHPCAGDRHAGRARGALSRLSRTSLQQLSSPTNRARSA